MNAWRESRLHPCGGGGVPPDQKRRIMGEDLFLNVLPWSLLC
jgi:hypothetical protein